MSNGVIVVLINVSLYIQGNCWSLESFHSKHATLIKSYEMKLMYVFKTAKNLNNFIQTITATD